MKRYLIAILWVSVGFFNYGYTLGYFTYHWPENSHLDIAVFTAVFGPFATSGVLISGNTKHWLLKPYTTEERWKIFQDKYPHLTRKDFDGDDD